MITDIDLLFKRLKKPSPEYFSCEKFNNSNLWIVKDEDENCGFLIENCKEDTSIIKTYINLEGKRRRELITYDQVLKDVYMVRHNKKIKPEIFSDSLNSYFNKNLKDKYDIKDIIDALKEIEAITKRLKTPLNEIIGVWGELFIIQCLVLHFKKNYKIIKEIIESWESPNGRALIDFKFNKQKLNLEIKTTTSDSRIHHISSLNQVSNDVNWRGLLASVCIKQGEGKSCNTLVTQILNLLDKESGDIFLKRLIIRGKNICRNNKYIFKINNKNEIRFFDFQFVPKPKINDRIFNIKWDVVLDNLESIDQQEFLNNINFDIQ